MRPPSFGSRSIQPPGKSSSIRPPRSGQSAPTNHSLRPSRQPSAPWVCLLVIALVVVVGAVVHLRGFTGSHAASDHRSVEDDAARYIPWGINSTSLFYARGFVDLETGKITGDVREKEFPTFISDDLIITCSDIRIICSAWDMSDVALSLRWSQKYPGSKAQL